MMGKESEYFDAQRLFHGSVSRLMGTRMELVLPDVSRPEGISLWEEVCRDAASMERVFDRFHPGSEVSRVNADAGRTVTVSGMLADAVSAAQDYWTRTGCLFDVTRGAFSGVSLQDGGRLSLHGADLDFGGFAKGYLLRRIKERLLARGMENAFVDFGASAILALGRHPHGDCWSVDVADPFHPGETLTRVRLCDQALSTSGNRPGYTAHIVHPHTGAVCRDRKLTTVVSADPLDAEVLSTALMIASPAEAALLRDHFPEAEMIVFDIR